MDKHPIFAILKVYILTGIKATLKRNVDLPILCKDASAEAGLQGKDPMIVQHLHRARETGLMMRNLQDCTLRNKR